MKVEIVYLQWFIILNSDITTFQKTLDTEKKLLSMKIDHEL
jgi:hypothetical protein